MPSLLGMALDYSPSLDRHDVRRKVGVITRAEIVGRNRGVGRVSVCEGFSRDCGGDCEIAAWQRSQIRRFVTGTAGAGWSGARWGDPCGCGSVQTRQLGGGIEVESFTEGCGGTDSQLNSESDASSEKRRFEPDEEFHPTIRAETCVAAGPAGLGLSYEVTDVQIADTRARVWTLSKSDVHGGGDSAERQSGLPGYLDRVEYLARYLSTAEPRTRAYGGIHRGGEKHE